MINKSELREGNWVRSANTTKQIESLTDRDVKFKQPEYNDFASYAIIQPITLTEGVKDQIKYPLDIPENIDSVHKLQNHHFQTTGKELEINL